MIETCLWILLGFSWVYRLAAWRVFVRFLSSREPASRDPMPPVSLLKPVKGLDAEAFDNFATFCLQDYREFEILFGVSNADDPVITVIRRLQNCFPNLPIRLIVAPSIGHNPKSSILHRLAAEARHDVFVISDSDMRVDRNYLRAVVAPLAHPEIGLVTCLFRSTRPRGMVARLAALGLNVDFLPSAVVAYRIFKTCMGIGATMVVRRKDLQAIGGYAAIADCLADDYQIASRLTDRGLRIHLSNYVVTNVVGTSESRQQWDREVRWGRNIRSLCPLGYIGLSVTCTVSLSLLLLLAAGPTALTLGAFVATLGLRYCLSARILSALNVPRYPAAFAALLPMRDVLSAAVWCVAVCGRSIVWRGQRYRLLGKNRLTACSSGMRRFGAALVSHLDLLLRRRQHIYEFSQDSRCLLRLSVEHAKSEIELDNGYRVQPGDLIGELHYWNEHLPSIGTSGPTLRWARQFREDLLISFRHLAQHVRSDDRMPEVRAFHARLHLHDRVGAARLRRLRETVGAEFRDVPPAKAWRARIAAWGEALLMRLLIWRFNPHAPRRGAAPAGQEVWIRRDVLLSRFGNSEPTKRSRTVRPRRRHLPNSPAATVEELRSSKAPRVIIPERSR
jgi:ceramide glucosyltransferase